MQRQINEYEARQSNWPARGVATVAVGGSLVIGSVLGIASPAVAEGATVTTVQPAASQSSYEGLRSYTGPDLDAMAAAAAASMVMGGVFLALGRRRRPIGA